MALVANLPPLSEKSSIAIPARSGVWSSDEINLDALADSFDIPLEDIRAQDLKSIPDVWAQFQVFNTAFVLTNHPMHREAVAQWRGLLALFALAREYGDLYEIDLRPVAIPRNLDDCRERFMWVLRYLLPQTNVADGLISWNDPVLLIVRERRGGSGRAVLTGEDQLLGMLNPVTLVAAGKSATQVKLTSIPWLATGLSDPLAAKLKGRDYAILADYATNLHNAIRTAVPRPIDVAKPLLAALVRELNDFAAASAAIAGPTAAHLSDCEIASPPNLPEFYKPLLKTRQIALREYEDGGECMVVMRTDIGAPPFKGIVLVDPSLADTLKRNPRDIRVWKHRTLSDIEAQPVFEAVKREANDAGYLIARPEDFFTNELVHIEAGSDIRGHMRGTGFESTVLPLSPLTLLARTPEQIAQGISISTSGGREHKISLDLSIAGHAGPHALTRTYRTDQNAPVRAVSDIERPLGFAVWPNFYHPSWRWNFLRFQHIPSSTDLLMRFGLSGQQLSRELSALLAPSERCLKMSAWVDRTRCAVEDTLFVGRVTPEIANQPYPPLQRLRFADSPNNVGEIQISADGFEAICLARRPDRAEAPRPVGFVLLKRQPPDVNRGVERVVAVDFGTTNTVSCFDGENAVKFEDRVVLPISSSSLDADRKERDLIKWSFVEFMPLLDHETPFPTVAKLRKLDDAGDSALRRVLEREDERPLFSDCVFFMPQEQGPTLASEPLVQLKDELKFGLKWNPEPLTRKVARRFLRQLVMMISVEMLAKGSDPSRAKWRFSYPEAMSRKTKDALYAAIRQSWTEVFCNTDGTRPSIETAENAVEEMITEGGAAANYFLFQAGENGLNAGPLSVILDIGGGTTEVAIWSRETLQWRGSFRLAGGDFVTHYLVNNPEFFEMIGLADLAQTRRSFSGASSTLVSRQGNTQSQVKEFAELFFSDRRFPVQFAQNYANIAETKTGAGLRHCTSVALGGLVFYLARVTRKLIDEGKIPEGDFRGTTFAFGGRGSQFFRQMAGRANAVDSPLHDILRIYLDALRLDMAKNTVRVLFSPKPKLEVVLGMGGNRDSLRRVQTEPKSNWLPLGETLEVTRDGAAQTLDPSLPVVESLNDTIAGMPALDELKRFLALHEKHTGIRITLDAGTGVSAADFISEYTFFQMGDALRAAREDGGVQDATTQLIEPPFIMSLRALIDRLGQGEQLRSQFLKVAERN